jgi:hypothetical protein
VFIFLACFCSFGSLLCPPSLSFFISFYLPSFPSVLLFLTFFFILQTRHYGLHIKTSPSVCLSVGMSVLMKQPESLKFHIFTAASVATLMMVYAPLKRRYASKRLSLCEISSSHGDEYDVQSCLLGSLMMEAVRTSETSVDNNFTRQYIPEDNSEHQTLSCCFQSLRLVCSSFHELLILGISVRIFLM